MPEQKKAHPLFVAAIVGIPAIGVAIMIFFKTAPPPETGRDTGAETSTEEPVEVEDSPALTAWKAANMNYDKLGPAIHKMTIKIGDVEDLLLEKEPYEAEKKAVVAELEKLKAEAEAGVKAADDLIAYYKEKFGMKPDAPDEDVLKRLRRMRTKEGNIGKRIDDYKQMVNDVSTKLRNAKKIGVTDEHSGGSSGSKAPGE